MTYITNSITSANPGAVFHDTHLGPALITAGFVLVDTVVIGGNTHKVYRSPAASNTHNKDWYLDVSYPTTGTGSSLLLRTFEHFDPATDLAYRGPGFGSYLVSDVPDLDTWSYSGDTGYALETEWSMWDPSFSLTTSAFTFHASVTTNRVILMFSNQNTSIMYAGFYDPDPFFAAQAGDDLLPLVCIRFGGGSDGGFGYLTRLPLVAEGRMPIGNLDVNLGTYMNARYMSSWFPTPADGSFIFHAAKRMKLVRMNNESSLGGIFLGSLLDVRYSRGNTGSSQVFGDTCAVTTNPALTGGDTYVLTQRNMHVFMMRTI